MQLRKSYSIVDVFFSCLGLMPIYLEGGFSINYFFLLIPLLSQNIKFKMTSKFLIYFSVFLLIYLFSFVYVSYNFPNYTGRSLISFLLFMSPLVFGGTIINEKFYKSLLIGILVFSSIYVFWQIFSFIKNVIIDGLTDLYLLKRLIGSNRVSIILVIAFLITDQVFNEKKYVYLFSVLFGIGVILTYSRAALITLIFGVIYKLFIERKLFRFRIFVLILLAPIIFGLILNFLIPGGDQLLFFFQDRIIGRFTGDDYSVVSNTTSEGIRLETWSKMINFLLNDLLLFTGTGYLGPWILNNIQVASSHNQFIDVVFRAGVIGFLFIYLPLFYIFKKGRKMLVPNLILFVLLFYGFFHETFKETQGSFLLGIIISFIFNPNSKVYKPKPI